MLLASLPGAPMRSTAFIAVLALAACRSDWKLDTSVPLPDCEYFADGDGDGFGDPDVVVLGWCSEAPYGAVSDATDCDDRDAAINPAAIEACNGLDDDCDGELDEGLEGLWYADGDGDGYGDPTVEDTRCDPGDGWVEDAADCDDADPAVNPAASELCNVLDDDCDGELDEGLETTWYLDVDGDGYGLDDSTVLDCDPGSGWAELGGDCDDASSAIHPGAQELCNGLDDDCDGEVDDADDDVLDPASWYLDVDGDGYGRDDAVVQACEQPSGYVGLDGDCDDLDPAYNPGASESDCADPADYNCDGSVAYADTDGDGYAACEECDDGDAAIHPGATELCNGADDDCDGSVDEDDAADASTWYADSDGDGYGDAASATAACAQPSGHVADASDCDDGESAIHPAATEQCDGVDNDCDGTVDEDDAADASTWYADSDGDGYGDAASSAVACTAPSAHVADATDCDDGDAGANPGADELCDGVDNDCDGTVDEDDASDASTWYADADGDGYGDASSSAVACTAPSGHIADSGDCDDGDAAIHPAATEICDGVDNDCDGAADEDDAADAGTWYADADGDGYGDASDSTTACTMPSGSTTDTSDCDDGDAAVNPGATEACNGVDDDCDGTVDEADASDAATWYVDGDGDGYGDAGDSTVACAAPSGHVADATDCDDGDAATHPGAAELCDGVDNDCDGALWTEEADADGDGYDLCADQDCDDSDASVGPDGDTDADGEVDCWDEDDDDDDIYDEDELDGSYSGFVTDPLDPDTDGDGVDDADDAAPLHDACAANLYLWDDFLDDPSSSWTDISGSWSWDGSDLFSSGDTTAGANTWVGSESWTDVVVEVVMRPDHGSNDPGFMTRVQAVSATNDGGDSYYIGLYPSSDSVVLGYQDGGWNVVASANATINDGSWYTLQHRMSGSSHEVWLDGSLIISATDSTYGWGSVGFRTYRSPASYDSILVCD